MSSMRIPNLQRQPCLTTFAAIRPPFDSRPGSGTVSATNLPNLTHNSLVLLSRLHGNLNSRLHILVNGLLPRFSGLKEGKIVPCPALEDEISNSRDVVLILRLVLNSRSQLRYGELLDASAVHQARFATMHGLVAALNQWFER